MKPYKWCRYCDKIKSECKCARPSIVLCENDHLEAVKQARADALRLVLEEISSITPPDHYDWSESGTMDEVCARLRAIIEKELSK